VTVKQWVRHGKCILVAPRLFIRPEEVTSMKHWRRLARTATPAAVAALVALVAALFWPSGPDPDAVALASPKGNVVLVWGVGGVLTDDGTLWQFRPESRRWVTVDQSFALDGERRGVLPLPVAVGEIAHMQGFGFIVTESGSAWLYNLDTNKWENIGAPGR
jgi:hypothetical protein